MLITNGRLVTFGKANTIIENGAVRVGDGGFDCLVHERHVGGVGVREFRGVAVGVWLEGVLDARDCDGVLQQCSDRFLSRGPLRGAGGTRLV